MAILPRLEGYEVIGAASRDEALQHVETHGLRPDLILCDFQLYNAVLEENTVCAFDPLSYRLFFSFCRSR